MLVSINQLAEWTGRDRRTITQRLADIPFTEGPKQAHLYDSAVALAAIYKSTNAKEALDQKRVDEIDLNMSIKRRERIPLPIVAGVWDAALQSFGGGLKAAKGKKLDAAKINELLEILRSAKLPLTW